jgi:hypothetical protein
MGEGSGARFVALSGRFFFNAAGVEASELGKSECRTPVDSC